ncbi:MAG: phosphatidylinositol-specific phospholipase C/glycerophosphodiester phosphodiesterase family protein [Planctomycetes bacterium]|nr:phosphatidylinositol-specific phospholipase C/glycerophosphodiester phosphodiesterase family protein [Planctomycetota bacterium]
MPAPASTRSIVAARAAALAATLLPVACATAPGAEPEVGFLHGHNDYLQPVPLRTALELGLGSVEADIFLVDGELRVGHERWQLRAGRTLASLYLEPLAAHVRDHGPLRANGAPFVLLVDIKAEPVAVWSVLRAELERHRSMLTRFTDGAIEPGAVTVILSGARPRAQLVAEAERLCALDGRLVDLDAVPPLPCELVPWISEAWSRVSDWTGADELLADERARVRDLVARTHAQGRELRFWGTPDRREGWQALRELGVDRIGTDRPKVAVAWARSLSVGDDRMR